MSTEEGPISDAVPIFLNDMENIQSVAIAPRMSPLDLKCLLATSTEHMQTC